MLSKAEYRKRLKEAVLGLSNEQRKAQSLAIRQQIQRHRLWRHSEAVLLYAPMKEEVDLAPLLPLALAQGKAVCLPHYIKEEDSYGVRQIRHPQHSLRRGNYGILEPDTSCPEIPLNQLDLALVPGVGFAPDGTRLGHGRGYFDRLLAQVVAVTCGVAFDVQLTEQLPHAPHDIRLDWIVTPTRWLSAGRRADLE